MSEDEGKKKYKYLRSDWFCDGGHRNRVFEVRCVTCARPKPDVGGGVDGKKRLKVYDIHDYHAGGALEKRLFSAHRMRARADDARSVLEETKKRLAVAVARHPRSRKEAHDPACPLCLDIDEMRAAIRMLYSRAKQLDARAQKIEDGVQSPVKGRRRRGGERRVELRKELRVEFLKEMEVEVRRAYDDGKGDVAFALLLASEFMRKRWGMFKDRKGEVHDG